MLDQEQGYSKGWCGDNKTGRQQINYSTTIQYAEAPLGSALLVHKEGHNERD